MKPNFAIRHDDGCNGYIMLKLPQMQSESSALSMKIEGLRKRFQSHETFSLAFRRKQLKALGEAIAIFEAPLLNALHDDLHKPKVEGYISELAFVLSDIQYTLRHLSKWAKPQKRHSPLVAWPASARVSPQPYGIALIMGPWNYPFQLLFSPMVGAIAAGNCICLKPSEFAPNTAEVISRLVGETFPDDLVTTIEGSSETAQSLIREKFDYIFFTGSTNVGREIMKAAARNLTPVTLELGGKSPCIVCRDSKIRQTARRIIWGKFLNAGQTCVAPDYVLVDVTIKEALLNSMRQVVKEFYGSIPQQSPDYGRIINQNHFARLIQYLPQGQIVVGGDYDEKDLYIAPTILTELAPDASVMQEEIFGPILPVLEFHELDDVFSRLAGEPKPLAMYLFTNDKHTEKRFLLMTASGGVCVNDTLTQILGKDLPFGGVGLSGMGSYHGKASFDTFSHFRSILKRSTKFDPSFRYPPVKIPLERLRGMLRYMFSR